MVVFIDYEQDAAFNDQNNQSHGSDPFSRSYIEPGKPLLSKTVATDSDLSPFTRSRPTATSSTDDRGHLSANLARDSNARQEREQPTELSPPNQNGFSAALSCYPVITEIAHSVDLNTLHALSLTCRQFHANLSPYRHQLVKQTLRCENEYIETLSDMLSVSKAAIPDSVRSVLQILSQSHGGAEGGSGNGRLTTGRVGRCARDLVGECRRCGRVVCRNCTIKPPPRPMFKNRLRRLCATCDSVPLTCHISSTSPPSESQPSSPATFTAPAFERTPCFCPEAVWLCHPCGQTIRSADTTYRRVWTWRTRYSTYLGGLGTGIGEGCQGVKCGRGEYCLAAQEIELEVDCDASELPVGLHESIHGHGHDLHIHDNHNEHSQTNGIHDDDEEPGYFRQEIVGIGGVVKQKAKKRVTVGACVPEHEDERESGEYLTREEEGELRSWCGWCSRVIPATTESDWSI